MTVGRMFEPYVSWRYDARLRATRPELCPEFIEPPAIGPDDVRLDDVRGRVPVGVDG